MSSECPPSLDESLRLLALELSQWHDADETARLAAGLAEAVHQGALEIRSQKEWTCPDLMET